MASDERDEEHPRTQADVLTEARRLAVDGIVDVLAAIHQARAEAREVSDSRSALPRAQISSSADPADLLFDLARLQVDILSRVLTFQRQHSEVLFGGLLRAVRGTVPSPAINPVVVRWPLDAAGLLANHSESASFVVENRSAKSARVRLKLGYVSTRVDPPERVSLAALPRFAPGPDFDLAPGEVISVTLALHDPGDSADLKPGRNYRGAVEVHLSGRPKLELPLHVEVSNDR